MQNNFKTLESKPVAQFFSFAVPAIIGMLLTSGIVIVDGLFIGNIIGKTGLASVNLTLPLFYLFLAVAIMIGVGGAVITGHSLGAGKTGQAARQFSLTTALVFIVIVLLTGGCLLNLERLVVMLNAGPGLDRLVETYLGTILWFFPAMMMNIVFSIFLRTQGRPGLALGFDLLGNGVNIILDYLLIARWGMGLRGAALASGISVILPFAFYLFYFISGRSLLKFSRFSFDRQTIWHIVFNGSSEMTGQISVGVTTWVFNRVMLFRIGVDGVAAYSIAGYIAFVQIMIITGFATGLGPIVGYYFGANNKNHINKVLITALISGFVSGVLCWVLVLCLSGRIAASFSPGNDVIISLARSGFGIFTAAFLINGFNTLMTAYFTSTGRAGISFVLAAVRGLILINLFVLILPGFMGDAGVWISYPLAELVSLLLTLVFVKRCIKKGLAVSQKGWVVRKV
jgi:putative MATE family efflux protein